MPRTSDEQDSTDAMRYAFGIVALVIVLTFITDWIYLGISKKHLLDGALLGVVIGIPLGWIGAVMGYFFPMMRNGKNNGGTPNAKP